MKMKKSSQPTAIGDLLQEILKKMPPHLSEELSVIREWDKVVGQEIARQTKPQSMKSGILFVQTTHPIWTIELQSKSHLICKKLNAALGKILVKEIRFRQARH